MNHSPLNATTSSVSVLQFAAERTESLVEGEIGHQNKQTNKQRLLLYVYINEAISVYKKEYFFHQ